MKFSRLQIIFMTSCYIFPCQLALAINVSPDVVSFPATQSDTTKTSFPLLQERENGLTKIYKNFSDYKFIPLRAGNTTPEAWIVQNNENQNVALLKCTSGNNYAQAEVASYNLGKMLNLSIYPVTIGVNVSSSLAKQLKISSQYCALKEWMNNYSIFYWKSQANIEKKIQQNTFDTYRLNNSFLTPQLERKNLVNLLLCKSKISDAQNESFIFTSGKKTKNGNPLINNGPTYFTSEKVPLLDVAKDFSNMMILDAVTGNGDRFPGANLEFRSLSNQTKKINGNTILILDPRLSSLDTGLSFKGWKTTWAQQEMTYYLRRFDPVMIENLKKLLVQLNSLTPEDLKGKWNFLDFNTQMNPRITAVSYLKTNIEWVLSFIESVQNQSNKSFIPKENTCNQIWLDS